MHTTTEGEATILRHSNGAHTVTDRHRMNGLWTYINRSRCYLLTGAEVGEHGGIEGSTNLSKVKHAQSRARGAITVQRAGGVAGGGATSNKDYV